MKDGSRVIILDRDGVINEDSDAYIQSPQEWLPIPGSLEAIAQLYRAGYTIVVATNQSGVGRGYFDRATLEAIHRRMTTEINRTGGALAGIFFCPHAPEENCNCRKPATGLLEQIREELGLDLDGAWVVGDSLRDLQCAASGGCRPALVLTGKGNATRAAGLPDELADTPLFTDLNEFARTIAGNAQGEKQT